MKERNINFQRIIYACVWAGIPIIACLILLAVNGKWFSDLFLPVTPIGIWNDEIIYYMQIDSMVKFGAPQGFFGYQQSTAPMLSFGPWSPVLFLPYAIWGKLFGWGYSSPIIFNIVAMTLAFFFLIKTATKDMKERIVLSLGFLSCAVISRYMLSGMAEIVPIVCVILLVAFISYCFKNGGKYFYLAIGSMYFIVFLLVLMRPYFGILIVFPFYFLFQKKRLISIVSSIMVGGISIGGYFWILRNLCCTVLFSTYVFKQSPSIVSESGEIVNKTSMLSNIINLIGDGIVAVSQHLQKFMTGTSDISAKCWGYFCVTLLGLVICLVIEVIKKRKQGWLIGLLLFCQIGMFIAFAVMSDVSNVGYRHLLAISIMGMLILLIYGNKTVAYGLILLFILISINKPMDASYQVSSADEEFKQEVLYRKEILQNKMPLQEGISWDNTITWIWCDYREDEFLRTNFEILYSVPTGMGVQIQTIQNGQFDLNEIKSKYVLVHQGGGVEEAINQKDGELLYQGTGFGLYRIR